LDSNGNFSLAPFIDDSSIIIADEVNDSESLSSVSINSCYKKKMSGYEKKLFLKKKDHEEKKQKADEKILEKLRNHQYSQRELNLIKWIQISFHQVIVFILSFY
jgi:hypothetical protein